MEKANAADLGTPPVGTEVKFLPVSHYFKVDKRILEIVDRSISKKALFVYLLHCRRANPKKNLGCSMAGYQNAKKCLGIAEKETYLLALEELQTKHLIKKRPDVGTRQLRTEAIEVLSFPLYDKKTKQFSVNNAKEHDHRTYNRDEDSYIIMPSIIIDSGHLKDLSVQGIFALLWLYSETKMLEYWGVNHNFLYAINTTYSKGYVHYTVFGEGYSEKIFKKNCVHAVHPNKYVLPSIKFQGNFAEALNEVKDKGLFELVPIIIRYDPEDNDMLEIIDEIFRGFIEFETKEESKNLYLIVQPGINDKIIWILRPIYAVQTPDLAPYTSRWSKLAHEAHKTYKDFDVGTSTKTKMEYIEEEDFQHFVINIKGCSSEVEVILSNIGFSNNGVELNKAAISRQKKRLIELLPNSIFRGYAAYKKHIE